MTVCSVFVVNLIYKDHYPVNHKWTAQTILDYHCDCIQPPHTAVAEWASVLDFSQITGNFPVLTSPLISSLELGKEHSLAFCYTMKSLHV